MFTNYPIRLINNHIIVDAEQQLIVDTGSPVSFHSSGMINLCGESIAVKTSIPGVSADYLSSKVGTRIDGLLGMDIIHRYPLMIDLHCGFMFVDDDAVYPHALEDFELGPLAQGLLAIRMTVNNRPVKMIVDTGAPVSYINQSIVSGMVSDGEIDDFHPLIGDFHTNTYHCDVIPMIGEQPYNQLFGVLPTMLGMTLAMIQADGIIGIELFKRYRIQIREGRLYLPPQGI
jgi:hypothetical protein